METNKNLETNLKKIIELFSTKDKDMYENENAYNKYLFEKIKQRNEFCNKIDLKYIYYNCTPIREYDKTCENKIIKALSYILTEIYNVLKIKNDIHMEEKLDFATTIFSNKKYNYLTIEDYILIYNKIKLSEYGFVNYITISKIFDMINIYKKERALFFDNESKKINDSYRDTEHYEPIPEGIKKQLNETIKRVSNKFTEWKNL